MLVLFWFKIWSKTPKWSILKVTSSLITLLRIFLSSFLKLFFKRHFIFFLLLFWVLTWYASKNINKIILVPTKFWSPCGWIDKGAIECYREHLEWIGFRYGPGDADNVLLLTKYWTTWEHYCVNMIFGHFYRREKKLYFDLMQHS